MNYAFPAFVSDITHIFIFIILLSRVVLPSIFSIPCWYTLVYIRIIFLFYFLFFVVKKILFILFLLNYFLTSFLVSLSCYNACHILKLIVGSMGFNSVFLQLSDLLTFLLFPGLEQRYRKTIMVYFEHFNCRMRTFFSGKLQWMTLDMVIYFIVIIFQMLTMKWLRSAGKLLFVIVVRFVNIDLCC